MTALPRTIAVTRYALVCLLSASVTSVSAQEVDERFPGVSLGLFYEARSLPTLAMTRIL